MVVNSLYCICEHFMNLYFYTRWVFQSSQAARINVSAAARIIFK